MDTEQVSYEDFRDCLKDLATVNKLTLAARPTLAFIKRTAKGCDHLHILDLGCGNGDMLRKIKRWAARRKFNLTLTGIDLNPHAARAAAEASAESAVTYVTENAFTYMPSVPVDVIISSLFTHHLDDNGIVYLLGWMEATARRGWFINDLRRSRTSYRGFRLLTALAHWHRFIGHDGAISIARSFRRHDWEQLLARAGIKAARIEGWFPFRLCVARVKG
jgi:SAM-dependent methyltransferase